MTPRGLSAVDVRMRNRAGLLRLIHSHGAIARNDLARSLGLTRASVTILANELLDEGLIVEAGSSGGIGKVGRRKIFLRIRPEAGKLLGVGIDAERMQVLIADLAGSVVAVRNLPSPAARLGKEREPGPALVRAVAEAAAELLGGRAPVEAGVLGAGLGVTGRVDARSGISLREPRLWEGSVPLADPLAAALGLPSAVDNNVRSLALAELLLTDARRSPPEGLLFIKYGPGVGGAWTTGGAPWAGAHYRAGEIGHTLVETEGPPCPYCGRRGCLESLVSARALGKALGRSGARIEELCAELAAMDPEAYALLAGRFARALGNAIELCDPGVVALYGAPFKDPGLFAEISRRIEFNDRPCEIRRSGLDTELPALGGAALALDRFLDTGGIRGQI